MTISLGKDKKQEELENSMPLKSVQHGYMDCGLKRQEIKINIAPLHGLS